MSDTLKRLLLWIAIVAALYAIAKVADVEDLDGPRRPLPPPSAQPPAWSNPTPASPPTGRTPEQPAFDISVRESAVQGDSIGTAFQVAPRTWVTAKHVVDTCKRTFIRVQGKWQEIQSVRMHDVVDVAVILSREPDGASRIALTDRQPVMDQEGFHYGFPQGIPSSLYTRFVGMARIRPGRPGTPIVRGWVWAEQARSPSSKGSLGGISGGPQVDRTGAVQGVTVLQSERAGRVTTIPSQRAKELLPAQVAYVPAGGTTITPRDYAQHGAQVRDSGAVALVFCSVKGNTRPRS
ncbi:MAG: trypsin-like peptidase domain-containing protein [Alphaproteobacteria bacterium]|nr:trypsin-like peptidase domain-containing protein [Alphaproteobacteria bacterium]